METIKTKELPITEPPISKEQIAQRLFEMGMEIRKDYSGRGIVLVPILNGAMMFCADLARQLAQFNQPVLGIEPIKVVSYKGRETTGVLNFELDISPEKTEGKEVLIVEDIADTGLTLNGIFCHFKEYKNPSGLRVACLLSKPSRRRVEVPIDYLGFNIPDVWVEGYGLDTDGQNRHLPYISVR
jgi:hypoxanthine phosphoribosyltransferase